MNVHIDNQDYADELIDELKCGIKYEIENGTLRTAKYTFTFNDEYKSLYESYSQFCNPLIYGKNTMLGVVAVEVISVYKLDELKMEEVEEKELVVFFFDGSVKTFPYKSWILTPHKEFSQDERLEGFLHYKYIHYTKPGENTWRIKDKFQIWNDREAAMALHGITMFKGMKPSQLGVLGWDIESAGLSHDNESTVFIITNSFQKNGVVFKKHFRKDEYEDVGVMIEAWCEWVRTINPDIMVGHNIYGYDLPYLNFVAAKFGKTLRLGRDGSSIYFNSKSSEYRVDGSNTWTYKKSHVYGRHLIDGMFLAVKYDFGRKYTSWGLKSIAEAEGLVKEGRTFYDASKIRENWHDPVEREKIVAYAIDDSDDSLNLYNLMIPAYFYMCQSLPIPFEEMMQGATGKWMNSIVVRSYLQDKRAIPKPDERITVHGGISFGNPKLYKNVYKVDVTSLYPSCILTYGIYPEKKDPDQNFLKMVRFFTEERINNKQRFKQTKETKYDDLQNAQKIAINSSYGMLGTSGLAFNDFGAANSVTLKGRAVLRKAILWASGKDVGEWFEGYDYTKDEGIDNELLSTFSTHDFIIGPTDTDSISFCRSDMSPFIASEQSTLLADLNSIQDKGIVFEDDGYFSQILAVAAKNYCLVENGSTKIKMKGSSIKDAKKEPILRQFMDEVIKALIYETGTVPAIYERYCNEARNITDISKWAVKKSISKKLLTSDRKQETDVVAALGDVSQYREGDKVYIYNTAPKFVPEYEDVIYAGDFNTPLPFTEPKPVLYKSGKNKGQVKGKYVKVVKLTSNYTNDADVEHYLGRVHSTLDIFSNVIDMSQFVCYTL